MPRKAKKIKPVNIIVQSSIGSDHVYLVDVIMTDQSNTQIGKIQSLPYSRNNFELSRWKKYLSKIGLWNSKGMIEDVRTISIKEVRKLSE